MDSDKHSSQKPERKKRKKTKKPSCPWKGQSRPLRLDFPREEGLLISKKVPEHLMGQLEALSNGWFEKIVRHDPLVESTARKLLRLDKLVEWKLISRGEVNKCKQILQKITNSLKLEKLKGPLWNGARIDDCDLVIAGKMSNSSNGHSPCAIHRDGEFEEGLEHCEYVTASVLLHRLTSENGSVKFWVDSVQFPHDKKNPKRYVSKEPEDRTCTWEGDKGTMRVWDARMLHQSLPNKTNETTLKFAWTVMTRSYIKKAIRKQKEQEREKKQKVEVRKRKATNKEELGE